MAATDQLRRGFLARHKALTALIVAVLAVLLALGGWIIYLDRQLADVTRFQPNLGDDRPARVQSRESLNILMAGVDDGKGTDLRRMLESGDWDPGVFRSDTMMVLHIDADRENAQVISIPRDSYVSVPGYGQTKINAAFSYGGPELLARTLEQNFDVYLDHIAVVDMDGFEGVTEAVGGVEVHVPGEGWTHVEGEDALAYVRQRYGLPGGDFDRIQRQQNFLRAVLKRVVSRGTASNPIKVTRLAGELSSLVAVDDSLDNGDIRELALDLRSMRPGDITFATVPYTGTPRINGASVVTLDIEETRRMFAAMSKGRFEAYAANHDINELPKPTEVD